MALGLTTSKILSAMPHAYAQSEKMSETPALLKAMRPMRACCTLTLQEVPRPNRSTQHYAKRVEVNSMKQPNVRIWSAFPMMKNRRRSVNVNFVMDVSSRVIRNAIVRNRRHVASAENTATTNSSVDGDRSQLHQPQQLLQLMFQRRWLTSIRLRHLND